MFMLYNVRYCMKVIIIRADIKLLDLLAYFFFY